MLKTMHIRTYHNTITFVVLISFQSFDSRKSFIQIKKFEILLILTVTTVGNWYQIKNFMKLPEVLLSFEQKCENH